MLCSPDDLEFSNICLAAIAGFEGNQCTSKGDKSNDDSIDEEGPQTNSDAPNFDHDSVSNDEYDCPMVVSTLKCVVGEVSCSSITCVWLRVLA